MIEIKKKLKQKRLLKFFNPPGKLTSQRRLEDVPKNGFDVLGTSPYGSICNARGHIPCRTSLGRTQDVNLTIIYEMDLYGISFDFSDSNFISHIKLQKEIKDTINPLQLFVEKGQYFNHNTQ